MSLLIKTIAILQDNYAYLVHDEESDETVVVDPSEPDPIFTVITEKKWKLKSIWNTHHHFDHVGGNKKLAKITSCDVFASGLSQKKIPFQTKFLKDKDIFYVGKYKTVVLETPGHTLDAISYFIPKEKALFTGDTLFSFGCGRLFEGTACQMWQSLEKIRSLPDDTLIYPGHEYTLDNIRFALSLEPENRYLKNHYEKVKSLRLKGLPSIPSLLSEEKKLNPFLRADDMSFVQKIFKEKKEPFKAFSALRRLKDKF